MPETIIHLSEDSLTLAEGLKISEAERILGRVVAEELLTRDGYEPLGIVLSNNEKIEARAFKSINGPWVIIPFNLKFIASSSDGRILDKILPLD